MILFSLFLPLSLFWNVCANDASSMVVLKVKRRFPLSVRLIISAVFTRIEFQLHQTLWVTDTRWIPVPELWPWVSGLVQNEPQPLEAMTLDALVVQGRSEVEWQSLLCRGAVGVSADESPQSRGKQEQLRAMPALSALLYAPRRHRKGLAPWHLTEPHRSQRCCP